MVKHFFHHLFFTSPLFLSHFNQTSLCYSFTLHGFFQFIYTRSANLFGLIIFVLSKYTSKLSSFSASFKKLNKDNSILLGHLPYDQGVWEPEIIKKFCRAAAFALKRLIKDTGILLGYLPYYKDVWEPETIKKFGCAAAFAISHLPYRQYVKLDNAMLVKMNSIQLV